jgi:hypothetical protein
VTTPERLRRRQRIEGTVVALLGLFTIYLGYTNERTDAAQTECISRNFADFNATLSLRSDLAEKESNIARRESYVTKKVLLIFAKAAGVLRDDPTKELPPKQGAALQVALVERLLDYEEVIEQLREERQQIRSEREKNPIPPFPEGRCD